MRWFAAVPLFALVGCAPVYLPSAASVGMLQGADESHVSALAVPGGGQLDVAHAFTDRLSVRATGHWAESSKNSSRYELGSAGVTWRLGRPDPDAWGAAIGLEAGGGSALGKLDIFSTTYVYSGSFFRAAAQGELFRDWRWGSLGFMARVVHFRLAHDSSSRDPGAAETWWFGEPGAVVRLGPRVFRVEGQLGVSIPLYRSSSGLSGFLPVFAGLGLSSNF